MGRVKGACDAQGVQAAMCGMCGEIGVGGRRGRANGASWRAEDNTSRSLPLSVACSRCANSRRACVSCMRLVLQLTWNSIFRSCKNTTRA